MTPPDPNVTPAPLIRGWKGGPWPAIGAVAVLVAAYAGLALNHGRLAPDEPRAHASAARPAGG